MLLHRVAASLFGVILSVPMCTHAATLDTAQAAAIIKARLAARKVVNLAWSIPTVRKDGKPLSSKDISGYDLTYLGRNTGKAGVVHIASGTQTSYALSGLAIDTYDLAIAAYDVNGVASSLSNVVSVSIDYK